MKERISLAFFLVLILGVLAFGQDTTANRNNLCAAKPFRFKEKGWYAAIRIGFLIKGYSDAPTWNGTSLLASVGYSWNRLWALGIGSGAEVFTTNYYFPDVNTYPIYLEARSYWLAKRITPFHLINLGYAFSGQDNEDYFGQSIHWKGGIFAKVQLGIRVGKHFILYGGYAHQVKQRTSYISEIQGENLKLKHHRLEAGISLVF